MLAIHSFLSYFSITNKDLLIITLMLSWLSPSVKGIMCAGLEDSSIRCDKVAHEGSVVYEGGLALAFISYTRGVAPFSIAIR